MYMHMQLAVLRCASLMPVRARVAPALASPSCATAVLSSGSYSLVHRQWRGSSAGYSLALPRACPPIFLAWVAHLSCCSHLPALPQPLPDATMQVRARALICEGACICGGGRAWHACSPLRAWGLVGAAGTTADMIFSIAQLISVVSKVHTLEEGDLLLTGACARGRQDARTRIGGWQGFDRVLPLATGSGKDRGSDSWGESD